MFRVKKPHGDTLSLRDRNAQIIEAYTMIKALKKLTRLNMPNTKAIA